MQEGESRITVTIEVETWWGHKQTRTVSVEPGLGWMDRASSGMRKVAVDMDLAAYTAWLRTMPTKGGA